MTKRSSQAGFTISELVLVLVVLGGLITIAVVSLRGIDRESAKRECRTELRALKAQSERFKAELSIYPPNDQALQDAGYLDLGDTPNWRVVTIDDADGPSYQPVGDRCRNVA
ncbi:MAG: prepilin-type N-terminal cleavage/methylation domain-containing protein [Acidimicrobiales bacterium]